MLKLFDCKLQTEFKERKGECNRKLHTLTCMMAINWNGLINERVKVQYPGTMECP